MGILFLFYFAFYFSSFLRYLYSLFRQLFYIFAFLLGLFVLNLFFYWRTIALQMFFSSIKPEHESAIGIHIFPPSWNSLPSPSPSHPSRLITEPLFEFPEPFSKSPLAIYFTYGNISFHVTLSIQITLSPPLPMSISLFSMSLSPLLPCK